VIGPPPGEGANLLWRRVDTFHFDCSKQVWKAVGVQWFGAGAGAASNASGPASSGPPHGMENYFPADSPPGPPPGSQLDPSDPSLATNPQTGTTYLRGKDRWVEAKTGKVLGAPQICTAGGLAYTPPPEAPSEPDKVQHKWREKEPDTERKSESSPTVVGIDLGVGLAKYSGVNDCSSWSAVYPRNSCSSSQTPSTYRAGADVQMGHFQVSAGYSVSGEATRNASAPLIGGVQGENSTFNTQFGYLLGGVRFPTDLGIAPYADLGLAFWKAALNATQSVTNASGTASASSSASLSGASFAFGAGLQYQFSSQLSVQLDYLHFQASKSPALAAQENMLTLDLIVTPF
jgi:opacity protein-like surface antigen